MHLSHHIYKYTQMRYLLKAIILLLCTCIRPLREISYIYVLFWSNGMVVEYKMYDTVLLYLR